MTREREGRVNVFSASVKRSELIGRKLRKTADFLCEGSLAPLLSHLVDGVQLFEIAATNAVGLRRYRVFRFSSTKG